MKRLTMAGSVLQVKQSKDKSYLYTCNPSPIHHKSNKIEHQLKILDFFIQAECPANFIIEPILGSYEPDIFFRDKSGNSICVEIQLTPISLKKMQTKINQFVSEFEKNHDSRKFVICSNQNYNKLKIPNGFKIIKQSVPKEINF